MERRVRDARVVEVLANIDFKVDTKADFQDKANLEPVVAALKAAKVTARLEREEEHEAWKVIYHDPTNAERGITIDLALQPEFRRMRTIARQVSKFNRPPFKIVKEGKAEAETRAGWRELLEQVKSEGTREVSIQRYKGSGRDERRAALGHHHERRNAHAAESGPARSGGDRNHLFNADGRGRGEPAQVYRRERAGRAESGRLKQRSNTRVSRFVESRREEVAERFVAEPSSVSQSYAARAYIDSGSSPRTDAPDLDARRLHDDSASHQRDSPLT